MKNSIKEYKKKKRSLVSLLEEAKTNSEEFLDELEKEGMEEKIPAFKHLLSDSEKPQKIRKESEELKVEVYLASLANKGMAEYIPVFIEFVAEDNEDYLNAARHYFNATKNKEKAIDILKSFKIWENGPLINRFLSEITS
jgi:hypothetical protein